MGKFRFVAPLIPAAAILTLAAAFSALSCELLDFPVEEFFAENTATVTIQNARLEPGTVLGSASVGTDGVICVSAAEPGDKVIKFPLDNPAGLVFDEAALVSPRESLPENVGVSARQSEDRQSVEISVSGASEGDELSLRVTARTAKEGRLLFERDLQIACVNFGTRLSELIV
ncbi:MAG: hypothetical protein LBH15_04915, partial [Treponema sp.]|nr:hypothetical protein [Treponema sp.]